MIGIEQSPPTHAAQKQSLGKRWEKLLHHPADAAFYRLRHSVPADERGLMTAS
ncbi:Uncharacterised protein [Serratia fonticola]|uniref:Uncharacterized protein n=1 Tax=Serratia fonticola TaxID=47917 RepID=A0A4U9TLX7_SERFO|nr:Uncharacterised protein [Serratia fonticola]